MCLLPLNIGNEVGAGSGMVLKWEGYGALFEGEFLVVPGKVVEKRHSRQNH